MYTASPVWLKYLRFCLSFAVCSSYDNSNAVFSMPQLLPQQFILLLRCTTHQRNEKERLADLHFKWFRKRKPSMIQNKYIISTARSIKRRCWYCSLLFYCGFRLIADHIVAVQFGGKISSFVSRLYTCVILDGCALAVWRGQVRREIRSEPETLRFHLPLFNWIRTILFFTFLNSLGVATIVSNSDDTFFSHVNNFSI